MRMESHLGLAFCVTLCVSPASSVGCGGDNKPTGREGGPCYANATCDQGFVCNQQGVCEKEEVLPDFVIVNVSAPDPSAAGGIGVCAERDALGADMQAVLNMGGETPCTLSVDPATLEAQGSCEARPGLVRPLALEYRLPGPDQEVVTLAVLIGCVDLRRETLGSAPHVELDLSDNTVLVSNQADVTALPDADDCQGIEDGAEKYLCDAKAWAKVVLVERDIGFDEDSDTESNLQEACEGTLFP